MGDHRVGKIIFKRSVEYEDGEALICIDGQQRITTNNLLLSSLRDGMLKWRRQMDELKNRVEKLRTEKENGAGGKVGVQRMTFVELEPESEENEEGEAVAIQALDRLKQELKKAELISEEAVKIAEEAMYRNVEKYHKWCENTVNIIEKEKRTKGQREREQTEEERCTEELKDEVARVANEVFPHGEKLEWTTLLPSFNDRSAFFELLCMGPVWEEIEKKRGRDGENERMNRSGGDDSSQPRQGDTFYPFSKTALATRMGMAKQYFDSQLNSHSGFGKFVTLRNGGKTKEEGEEAEESHVGLVGEVSALQSGVKKVRELVRRALEGLSLARIEVSI